MREDRAKVILIGLVVSTVLLAAGTYVLEGAVWRMTSQGVSTASLLQTLRAESRFARLDLVVEYPFGASDGPYMTMGGCLASGDDARAARRALYAAGATVVFDATQRTPTTDATPGYLESVCKSGWIHDGRSVFKFMALPARPSRDLSHIPVADRSRVGAALDAGEDLQSLGVRTLELALQEIYRDLSLWNRGVYDPEALIRHTQMKLEIWARMPPQDVQGESLSPAEWRRRQAEATARFLEKMRKEPRP